MATDALIAGGGTLAALQPTTVNRLNAALPATWSHANPVDIIGDAGPERYRVVVEAVMEDDGHDALLVMNVPTALARGDESARAVAELAQRDTRCVLAAWMGGAEATKARAIFDGAGVPVFNSPDHAVRAFLQMVTYRRNQELLMQTPPSMPEGAPLDVETARRIVSEALAAGRDGLTEQESKRLVASFGIPVVETETVATAEEAVAAARRLGFPVVVKVWSREISHKSDVGGVELNLTSPERVAEACRSIRTRVSAALPHAAIDGFTVQTMAPSQDAFELIIGAKTDPIFGPVMIFGEGGTAVEVVRDRAVCLPPLNRIIAADLVSRTRIYRELLGYRNRPAADLEALYMCLIQAAQFVVELPEIESFDINPLVLSPRGAIAVDARVALAHAGRAGARPLAIRPYPRELEEVLTLADGSKVLARPIRPEDEPAHQEFLSRLRPEDVYFRFFGLVREFPHAQMARYTQIDYDREMAFIAVGIEGGDVGRTLGVVRAVSNSQHSESEFAIIVRSDLKGHGLGRALLDKIIRYCKADGQSMMTGRVFESFRSLVALSDVL
jgi:acetyltransferase